VCLRSFRMQPLDHLSIERDGTLVPVFGNRECSDDAARRFHLVRRRRKDFVARGDLGRMNQGFAVEAESARAQAFRVKTFRIRDAVVNAIDDRQPVRARCKDGQRQGGGEVLRGPASVDRACP